MPPKFRYSSENCSDSNTNSKGNTIWSDFFIFYFLFFYSSRRVNPSFQGSYFRYFHFFSSALIADHTGSYIYSFYMTGGVLLTASLIPVIMIFINWRNSKHHPQTLEVELHGEAQTEQAQEFGRTLCAGTDENVQF